MICMVDHNSNSDRKPAVNLTGDPPTRAGGMGTARVGQGSDKSNPYPYPDVPYP